MQANNVLSSINTPRTEFISGVKAELPLMIGVIPFGMIYGILAIAAGLPPSIAQAMSFIIFAGSSQFASAQLFGLGVPAMVNVFTIAVINLRHALYSASIAPYLQRLPTRWKLILAYLLTDEAYAVSILHYQQEDRNQSHPVLHLCKTQYVPQLYFPFFCSNSNWISLDSILAIFLEFLLTEAFSNFIQSFSNFCLTFVSIFQSLVT